MLRFRLRRQNGKRNGKGSRYGSSDHFITRYETANLELSFSIESRRELQVFVWSRFRTAKVRPDKLDSAWEAQSGRPKPTFTKHCQLPPSSWRIAFAYTRGRWYSNRHAAVIGVLLRW
jgi:hypothetical protein